MKATGKFLMVLASFCSIFGLSGIWACEEILPRPDHRVSYEPAQLVGRMADNRLVECSGMDVSLTAGNFLWAINDGGHGSFIYALGLDGRSLGRVAVLGAQNRDWEGLDTFFWQGRPMILIADFGDNKQVHDAHTLYIVEEPRLKGQRYSESAAVDVAWRIVFSYPDSKHDAEGVAVDALEGKVFVLTKRDNPPLLFEVPLKPSSSKTPVVARQVAAVTRIPPPTREDLRQKYGLFRSQPTALDFSSDRRHAVVLTYKHAYIFHRSRFESWESAFSQNPMLIPLPLPQDRSDLRQREAICFSPSGKSLFISSEGKGAGLFLLKAR
jgi:hypothetical protein